MSERPAGQFASCPVLGIVLGCLGWLALFRAAPADDVLLKDPTRPAFATTEKINESVLAPTPLHLQSTITSAERRLAVIDGQVVSEGTRLGQFEVVKIDASQVLLRSGEARLLLKLPHDSVRPTAKEEVKP